MFAINLTERYVGNLITFLYNNVLLYVIIEKYCKKAKYKFIKRLPRLAQDNASGNDVLNYHQSIVDADYYFQIYILAVR